MAIDTLSKRASALLEGIVWPSGTIDASERAAAAWLYNGNSFAPAVTIGMVDLGEIILGFTRMGTDGPTLGGM